MLRGSLDRESLRLGVVRLKTPEQRLAWLAEHLGELPGTGIVYCLTVAATQEVAEHLRAHGHAVAAYSGQTEPTERLALEQDLLEGRVKALVATSALGMGFDASLGFVVNLGAPPSPVAYYQQVGRAGRGTDDATVVLVPAGRGPRHLALLRLAGLPARGARAPDARRARRLTDAAVHGDAGDLRRADPHPPRGDAQGARRRRRRPAGPGRLGVHRAAMAVRRRSLPARLGRETPRAGRHARPTSTPSVAGCGSCATSSTTPTPRPCGRCDNCGGLEVTAAVSEREVEQAHERLVRPGVVVEPRKMWPTALANLGLDLSGRIEEQAEQGRAIARLTDLGHGQALRELFREDAGEGPVPALARRGDDRGAQRLAAAGRRDRRGRVARGDRR